MNVALHPLNVLSICAGVGGLELGLQLAHAYRGEAVRGVCYVEREAAAAASLVASMEAGWLHPAPIWSDARSFDGTSWRGLVDIVTSGDPCQGNSVAGKRLGQLDDRWLLDRAIDIFDQTGADTFFRENVPGNADGQLAVAVPALERLGCRVAVGIFSSAETGNTMRRERLFILAKRDSDGCARCSQCYERSIEPRQQTSFGHHDERCCSAMGSTSGPRSLSGAHPRLHRGEKARGPRDAESERRGSAMGSAIGCGDERKPHDAQRGSLGRTVADRAGLDGRRSMPPAVIPGPADNAGWRDLLDRYPEYQPALSQEEAESHLRRGIDAMAHRIERLRATGNGVDPLAAATAFLSLDAVLRAGAAADGDVLMSTRLKGAAA